MTNQYLVHLVLTTDKTITYEQVEELASYLEVQLDDGTNVRAEVTYSEQI